MTQRIHLSLALLVSVSLTACGSMQVFDLPKVQNNLNETMLKSQAITQKSESDFLEKKTLIENLNKSASPGFKENERELRRHLKGMDDALKEMIAQKKNMSEARGELASMSYNRTKVRSDEREYPGVEDAVNRFEQAAEELNGSVVDYSRESNSLADIISSKKLYFTFDVAEFQKRVQKSISGAQENQRNMQSELTRAQTILDGNKTETRPSQEKSLEDMRAFANDYTDRASRFGQLSQEVHGMTLGMAKTSTLDDQWPKVARLVTEFDRTVTELAAMSEGFNKN